MLLSWVRVMGPGASQSVVSVVRIWVAVSLQAGVLVVILLWAEAVFWAGAVFAVGAVLGAGAVAVGVRGWARLGEPPFCSINFLARNALVRDAAGIEGRGRDRWGA